MPKVEGGSLVRCMEICVGDEKGRKEYGLKKLQQVCYAACAKKYNAED